MYGLTLIHAHTYGLIRIKVYKKFIVLIDK